MYLRKINLVFLGKLVLVFSLFIATEVSLYASSDDANIRSTIVSYNKGIIEASKTGKTDHMLAFANEDIVKKFYLWVKSWHDNNLFMDADIIDINFNKIEIDGDKSSVITDEKWIYKYIDIKIRKEVLKKTNIAYKMKYILAKEKERWIIQKIDVLAEK